MCSIVVSYAMQKAPQTSTTSIDYPLRNFRGNKNDEGHVCCHITLFTTHSPLFSQLSEPLYIMLFLPLTTLFLFSWNPVVNAGSQTHGDPCSLGDNRLQAGTYQFYSDCSTTNYCASNSTCLPKGCRKDDFPFGYVQDSPNIPDKCARGQFCPDEMDACQDLLAVGSACQLNRDGQQFRTLISVSSFDVLL